MKTLLDRVELAQTVHDKFAGKPFDWGNKDCIQLLKFTAMKAGRPNPLKGHRDYSGELGALRTLKEAIKAAGLPEDATLVDLIDLGGFTRIDAAAALPGDLIGLQGDAPWGVAVGVSMGNGKALAFADDPESGEQRAIVGEALINVGGVVPALTAWSIF